jgi:hypothetical protein
MSPSEILAAVKDLVSREQPRGPLPSRRALWTIYPRCSPRHLLSREPLFQISDIRGTPCSRRVLGRSHGLLDCVPDRPLARAVGTGNLFCLCEILVCLVVVGSVSIARVTRVFVRLGLDAKHGMCLASVVMASRSGRRHNIGSGWERASYSRLSAQRDSWERGRVRTMKGSSFRMSPFGTDMMGMPVRHGAPVGRCVSSADSSLSLSLSLSCPCSSPRLAAGFPRFPERSRGWASRASGSAFAACFAASCAVRARVRIGLGHPPHNPWRVFEEASACVPTRAGAVSNPERRGPTDLGSRRSPVFATQGSHRSPMCTDIGGWVRDGS